MVKRWWWLSKSIRPIVDLHFPCSVRRCHPGRWICRATLSLLCKYRGLCMRYQRPVVISRTWSSIAYATSMHFGLDPVLRTCTEGVHGWLVSSWFLDDDVALPRNPGIPSMYSVSSSSRSITLGILGCDHSTRHETDRLLDSFLG